MFHIKKVHFSGTNFSPFSENGVKSSSVLNFGHTLLHRVHSGLRSMFRFLTKEWNESTWGGKKNCFYLAHVRALSERLSKQEREGCASAAYWKYAYFYDRMTRLSRSTCISTTE